VAERSTHYPRFPLTADMSEVLAAARHDRAEAIGRSFVRLGGLLAGLDPHRVAQALLRLFKPNAYRSDRGTVH
jgi:hypothetical protein